MKKMIAVTIVAAGMLAAGALCPQQGLASTESFSKEQIIQFQQESAGLRGEATVKKLELIGETMKQPADAAKIKVLAHEVIDLQGKIGALANKHGLPGPSAFQQVIKANQVGLSEAELKALAEMP
ncbi:hypothetical protein OR1_00604 [Geobacter sp. OR-1]|uniref:hypothetical protein n=1 Tax=Geobacter sp. OR-1 TaxID=1266765 RepID=UPI0005435D01|nr:hypothetical protein [Geobacter sp. OR-1]GAM08333.1 hypothetical protein OR1_00604 [Geobacter sp. OR-1]